MIRKPRFVSWGIYRNVVTSPQEVHGVSFPQMCLIGYRIKSVSL